MEKKLIAGFVLFSSLILNFAYANDTTGTTAAGGINFTKNPNIVLQREELTIGYRMVKVSYLFENKSDQDITTQVFFPLPPYKSQSVYGAWDQPNSNIQNSDGTPFVNFSVTANGRQIPYSTMSRAILKDEDITANLQEFNIPIDPALLKPNVKIDDKIIPKWRTKANALGLLDKNGIPRWQKQTVFAWTQTFPAHQAILIEHKYYPAAGKFYAALNASQNLNSAMSENIKQIQNIFNLNLDNLQNKDAFKNWLTSRIQSQIHKQKMAAEKKLNENSAADNNSSLADDDLHQTENPIYAYFYNIDYILTTGTNWDGPIKNFTLKIFKPRNGSFAYNTFYGKQTIEQKDEPKEKFIFIKNFKPTKELRILFVSAR